MYVELCRKLWIAARNLKDDTRGIASLEYAILAALILGALAVALTGNTSVADLFKKMTDALTSANTAAG